MAGVDIASIISGADVASKNITEAMFGVQANTAAEAASYKQSVDRTKQAAEATAVVTSTKEYGQLAVEKSLTDFAVAAQGDIGDLTGTQSQLASKFNIIEADRAAMLPDITKKLSANLLTDPISWIMAQLTVDSDIAAYNSKGQEASQTQEHLLGINAMIDARFSALTHLKQTTSTASAEASIQLAKDTVLNAADTLARQGIVANTANIKEIAALSAQQLQTRALVFNAEVNYQNLIDAQERLVLAQRADRRDEERLQEFLEDRSDKRQASKDLYEAVRRGMIASGASAEDMAEVSSSGLRNMIAGRTPTDPKMLRYYWLGKLNIRAGLDPNTRILGADATEAINTMEILKPKLSPDGLNTYTRINQGAMDALKGSTNPGVQEVLKSKDPVKIGALINKNAADLLESDAQHTSDPKSLYYLPGITVLVHNVPELQKLPLWDKILKPAVEAGVDFSDTAAVNSYITRAILQGNIKLSDAAAQLSTIYKTSQEVNFASKQFVALGLAPKLTYMGSVGRFQGTVDFTSAPELARSWMKSLAIVIGQQYPSSQSGNPTKLGTPTSAYDAAGGR